MVIARCEAFYQLKDYFLHLFLGFPGKRVHKVDQNSTRLFNNISSIFNIEYSKPMDDTYPNSITWIGWKIPPFRELPDSLKKSIVHNKKSKSKMEKMQSLFRQNLQELHPKKGAIDGAVDQNPDFFWKPHLWTKFSFCL